MPEEAQETQPAKAKEPVPSAETHAQHSKDVCNHIKSVMNTLSESGFQVDPHHVMERAQMIASHLHPFHGPPPHFHPPMQGEHPHPHPIAKHMLRKAAEHFRHHHGHHGHHDHSFPHHPHHHGRGPAFHRGPPHRGHPHRGPPHRGHPRRGGHPGGRGGRGGRSNRRPEVCRFYMSHEGCARGNGCFYVHPVDTRPWRLPSPPSFRLRELSSQFKQRWGEVLDVRDVPALPPLPDGVEKPEHPEMVILVGFPASGKSTHFRESFQRLGHVRVNQDQLGDRRKCMGMTTAAVSAGRSVVIDRCNFSQQQRAVWIRIARSHRLPVRVAWLRTPLDLCRKLNQWRGLRGGRVVPEEAMDYFASHFETPMSEEGFAVEVVDIEPSLPMREIDEALAKHVEAGHAARDSQAAPAAAPDAPDAPLSDSDGLLPADMGIDTWPRPVSKPEAEPQHMPVPVPEASTAPVEATLPDTAHAATSGPTAKPTVEEAVGKAAVVKAAPAEPAEPAMDLEALLASVSAFVAE